MSVLAWLEALWSREGAHSASSLLHPEAGDIPLFSSLGSRRVVFTAEVTAGPSSRTQQEVIFGMWIVCVCVLVCICVSVLAYV